MYNMMLKYSLVKFTDVPCYILCGCMPTAFDHKVPVPCSECVLSRRVLSTQHFPTQDTSDVCIQITTYNIKSGTSMILFKVMSASLYLKVFIFYTYSFISSNKVTLSTSQSARYCTLFKVRCC
jgi:hypothetical protein